MGSTAGPFFSYRYLVSLSGVILRQESPARRTTWRYLPPTLSGPPSIGILQKTCASAKEVRGCTTQAALWKQ